MKVLQAIIGLIVLAVIAIGVLWVVGYVTETASSLKPYAKPIPSREDDVANETQATPAMVLGNPSKYQDKVVHFYCEVTNVVSNDSGKFANVNCWKDATDVTPDTAIACVLIGNSVSELDAQQKILVLGRGTGQTEPGQQTLGPFTKSVQMPVIIADYIDNP